MSDFLRRPHIVEVGHLPSSLALQLNLLQRLKVLPNQFLVVFRVSLLQCLEQVFKKPISSFQSRGIKLARAAASDLGSSLGSPPLLIVALTHGFRCVEQSR